MINIKIAGYEDFKCRAGSTIEDVVRAIRSMYGLINGGIRTNDGMIMLPRDTLEEDAGYEFVLFAHRQSQQGKRFHSLVVAHSFH